MTQADYRGARGSNAGDDFHELWALRQALTLLNPSTELTAITVEGLRAEDESGTPLDTWDGVDGTFYYGGDKATSAERIVISQLKYSAANPDQAWTIARLTYARNKQQDNSIIAKLAKAFAALKIKRPDLAENGNIKAQFISNQPIDPEVLNALSNQSTSDRGPGELSRSKLDRTQLYSASGLSENEFEAFAGALDFSGCGQGSRFALEEQVLLTVSSWMDDDARTEVNNLVRFVQRMMLPEGKREFITRQSILAWLGFSDFSALFPCISAIKRVEQLIPREVSRSVTERMLGGDQRICLHGEGGCGKTTALQEIEGLLPEGSVIVVFDCYGGGRYLDSDAYRHRPRDAFLQLSNDLARQLKIPLLLSRSAEHDYPRAFKKRLEKAAEVVAASSSEALLVIVVDAADNSVTAANTQSPPEKSFVHDFALLGDLPRNVRLLITGRTGRLPSLNLPDSFISLPITGFTQNETAIHVREIWSEASEAWAEDFHYLSGGNPRVQRYALDYAATETAHALNYLRPHGKGLDQVFQEQLEHARRKVGQTQDIQVFCSGLIALPRPIPVGDLSAVTQLSEAHLHDLCADLAPGVRLVNGLISFADEDFEHFVYREAEAYRSLIQNRMADHFMSRHQSNAYASTHVAAALMTAGRGQEIIDLVKTEAEPVAIGDPVLRREAHLQRLRMAMKVCRQAGNNVDAMLTLLIGAEALKTDVAIQNLLIENSDLTAIFAREASTRLLRDPKQIERHGPLLFHFMAADARMGNNLLVREDHRHVQAWLQRRTQSFKEQKAQHPNSPPHGWSIRNQDVEAETEALLRSLGPQQAVSSLKRWHPKSMVLNVASSLAFQVITAGETSLVERCLTEAEISSPWDLFLLTPLALAGKEVDLSRLESGLATLLRRKLIRVDHANERRWTEDHIAIDHLDLILTACEVVVGRGGNRQRIIPVLEQIADPEARRRDRLYPSDAPIIDFTLRAYALLERLAGRQPTLETYWVEPPPPPEGVSAKEVERRKRADQEKKEELRAFIESQIELYDVRAQVLTGMIAPNEIDSHLQSALARYQQPTYRLAREYWAYGMRRRSALSLTRLMALTQLDRAQLFERACSLLNSDSLGAAEAEIFQSFALDSSLHPQILHAVTVQAQAIRKMKISSEDKIEALIRFARLLRPISQADAESLFNEAVVVAGEVNADAIHEIALFAPLAERAVSSMDAGKRRTVARDLAMVVSDTQIRLEGHDHFPWIRIAEALTTLDVCLTLAAVARWEDMSLVSRHIWLPTALETALSRHALSPAQVAAFSSVLDEFDEELSVRLVEMARQHGVLDLKVLTEELAKNELLRFGHGRRSQLSEKLTSLRTSDPAGFWADQLARTIAFHQTAGLRQVLEGNQKRPVKNNSDQPDPLIEINWAAYRFVSSEEIDEVIRLALAKSGNQYSLVSVVLSRIREGVTIGDRVAHLEVLSHNPSPKIGDYELVRAITQCVEAWREAPAVERWCHERLLQVVVNLLPTFSRWLAYGDSPLPDLLRKSGLPHPQICAALLEALERHVDAFDVPTLYALVGLVGQYCAPQDAAQVISDYADRLLQRIPVLEREDWDLADIPTEAAGGVARFMYALMGDIDVRIRWRAAHALRQLALFGEINTLDQFIGLYQRTSERSYRVSEAPFYWLSARLWLMIALDRIATETPSALGHHGQWLLEITKNKSFPHLLVHAFAKSAVSKLVAGKVLTLNRTQRDALKCVNKSPIRRKRAQKSRPTGFDRYVYREGKDRRFRFDSMDTLPYWYDRALRAFADVSQEEFLETAERWIIDQWGIKGEPWRWDQEIRKGRFSDRALVSSMNRHGSHPILERFHTHLEWHAMWCTIGELMQARALATVRDHYAYDALETQLNAQDLTIPPFWLADLRRLKPLEARLWFAPSGEANTWIEAVEDDNFLDELGLMTNDGMLVIASSHTTLSSKFKLSAGIETALVSPDTAGALARALQAVDDSWAYRIPPAGDDHQIDDPPYKLLGWLEDIKQDEGIDEFDPLRYGIRSIEHRPSRWTAETLNLEFIHDDQIRWVEAKSRKTVFIYEAWGDTRGDIREEDLRYSEIVHSSGWRLKIDHEALRIFLNQVGLDLIVEVEITRRNEGYDYSRYDEEEAKAAEFDRILILRQDGSLEAAEGHLGTWTTSRT
jgi:hypothetical protein